MKNNLKINGTTEINKKMSQTENLFVATQLTPNEVLRRWFQVGNLSVVYEQDDESGSVFGETTDFVANAAATSEFYQSYIDELCGIVPKVKVGFDLAGVDNRKEATHRMRDAILAGTLGYLDETKADAALFFQNDGIIVLIHKDGELVLNTLEHIWTPERLQLIRRPYKMERLALPI